MDIPKYLINVRSKAVSVVTAVVFAFGITAGWLAMVQAAPLTTTYLRLSRMSTSTASSLRLVFKTGSAGATSLSINMNGADTTSWTGSGGLVNTTQTVSSAGCATETGATALPGTLAASGASSTISITGITALSAGATYCVDLTSTSAVTNPTSVGEYHPLITAGSDSITVAVRIVGNDSVTINAVVPPSFNFVLNANTDNFTANLDKDTISITTGVTATVNTNAKTGWIAWAKDSNSGLTSAAAGKTIASRTPGTAATLATNAEGYVFGVTNIVQGSGLGSTTAATAYSALTATPHGSGLDTTLRQIASSDGTASNAVLTFKSRATIDALTPAAADYTDTVTIIGAAKF